MKKLFVFIALAFFGTAVFAQTKTTTPPKSAPAKPATSTPAAPKPLTNIDTASYGFGLSLGTSLRKSGIKEVNFELINKAIKDSFNDTTLLFTQEQIQSAIQNLFEKVSKEKFASIIKENEEFFEKNKLVEGVKTTASGIQYQVITEGNGVKPSMDDTVTVHYKGTLTNNEQFDSSYERGTPAVFNLKQVIPGWSESVMLMSEGAKYRFWIPADLGYGERGAGDDIPPYSTLIFEIELIKVAKP